MAQFVSLQRHLELLKKETDIERRLYRKQWAFHALYSGDPNAQVLLPDDYLEEEDLTESKRS